MSEVKYVSHFPLLGILGLIFVTLKLTGYITWSWWWVLSPFWIPILAALILMALIFFFVWNK
jgi:FtsH-binding integral membrane protein